MLEEQVKTLQTELSKAQLVHAEFLNQKQENALLKETIDRLRYDLDDLRSAHANDSTKGGSSAPGSAMPSLSRTLGSELLRKMDSTEEQEDDSDAETTVEETIEESVEQTDDGEEDVFQTIITRKRVRTLATGNEYISNYILLYRKLPEKARKRQFRKQC